MFAFKLVAFNHYNSAANAAVFNIREKF